MRLYITEKPAQVVALKKVVKGNVYIKFSTERINDIRRRTSNCTICAVNDPSKNITSKSIELTTTI